MCCSLHYNLRIVLIFVRFERNPLVVMFRISCSIAARSRTDVYLRRRTIRTSDSFCFRDICLPFMPSSTDPDHFQRNFLVNILARYGTAETANSLAYSLPQLTTVFHALAVSPGRVMAQRSALQRARCPCWGGGRGWLAA